MMRKVVLFLTFTVVFASCSKMTHEAFNPPEWLQGTWENDDETAMWEITEHNLVYTTDMGGGSISTDYKKMYRYAEVSEESSGDTYSFTCKSSSGGMTTSLTETFRKISSSKMKTGDGDTALEFTRQ